MTERSRWIATAALAAVIGFGMGAAWQATAVRDHAQRLAATDHELRFQRLQATLGAATVEAQRGSYEIARQLASDFFTALQQEVMSRSTEQHDALQEILQQRDAMITALSRSDPQSGALLAQLFVRLRIAMGETVGPAGTTAPATGQ